MRLLCILVVFLYSASVARTAEQADLEGQFAQDTLIIEASRFACYLFQVYLAEDMQQQRRGLMFVRTLPEFTGMLFIYEDQGVHSMWMKNTFIPLDISFIRQDGSIANIARNTEPQSLKSISSAAPVSYVLELNAGVTERLHIDQRSRVLWGPVFEYGQAN